MRSAKGREGEGAVWLIAGPTASGKSRLALDLALQTGAEILNADASQLYRDLCVITARPSQGDLRAAPHHLYGFADAADAWSTGRWLRAAEPLIAGLVRAGRPVIVVGGTGLYFRSLTHGLADAPATDEALRARLTSLFETEGEAAFRARLLAVDPAAEGRIAANDRQRLIRALAVHEATGRALTDWRQDQTPVLSRWKGLVLQPDRETLYARCDLRVGLMQEAGALEEARALSARGLSPDLPLLKAVGYREFAAAAAGELSLEAAMDAARMETRRYAKRQLTWLRNQTPDWPRIETLTPEDQLRQAMDIFEVKA